MYALARYRFDLPKFTLLELPRTMTKTAFIVLPVFTVCFLSFYTMQAPIVKLSEMFQHLENIR